jgi:hypothetical protein
VILILLVFYLAAQSTGGPAPARKTSVSTAAQGGEMNAQDELDFEETVTGRGRGKSWNEEDDVLLARSYVWATEDAVNGTNQTSVAFFQRMATFYAENMKKNNKRTPASIKSHWSKVQSQYSKFAAAVGKAQKAKPSGASFDDLKKIALEFYFADVGLHFKR